MPIVLVTRRLVMIDEMRLMFSCKQGREGAKQTALSVKVRSKLSLQIVARQVSERRSNCITLAVTKDLIHDIHDKQNHQQSQLRKKRDTVISRKVMMMVV